MAYGYRGDMLIEFFDVMLRTYHENLAIFSTTQRISIPIAWDTQHAPLPKLSIFELAYLRDKLVENRDYWSGVVGRSDEWQRCTNFWICPSQKLLA